MMLFCKRGNLHRCENVAGERLSILNHHNTHQVIKQNFKLMNQECVDWYYLVLYPESD